MRRPRKNPAAVLLGRKGGAVSSDVKAIAARENGRLGGRPRMKPRPVDEDALEAEVDSLRSAISGADERTLRTMMQRVGASGLLELFARVCEQDGLPRMAASMRRQAQRAKDDMPPPSSHHHHEAARRG